MFLLDKVRADLLMLRVISESLVMWDYIHPSEQWIMAHLPNVSNDAVDWFVCCNDVCDWPVTLRKTYLDADCGQVCVQESGVCQRWRRLWNDKVSRLYAVENISCCSEWSAVVRYMLSTCVGTFVHSQIYCNILAGACFSMGLKFAGSANQQAYKCLVGTSLHRCFS